MGKGAGSCDNLKTFKIILLIWNGLFFVMGSAAVGCGIYAYIELRDYLDFLGIPSINAPGIILITFGSVIVILTGIGFFGALRESSCLLVTYGSIVAIIILCEATAGILGYVFKDQLETLVKENAVKLMVNYKDPGTTVINTEAGDGEGAALTWDFIQRELECCGVNNYTDWSDQKLAPKQYLDGPPASCKDKSDNNYQLGCIDKAVIFAKDNLGLLAGLAVGFAGGQITGITMSCYLAHLIRRSNK